MKAVLIVLAIICSSFTFGQNKPYSFFVAGHPYYGKGDLGIFPPFFNEFSKINNRDEISFGVFVGDIVKTPSVYAWDRVDEDLDSLDVEVHFAVGNHDMKDRNLYEQRYGITYYDFTYQNDLFIILDPNIDNWNISGEQLFYLKDLLHQKNLWVDNIYVFFHQLFTIFNYYC